MLPVKGIIFLGLNALRSMSILSLILVFSSTIVLMVNDSNGYNSLKSQNLLQSSTDDCDYFPQTDVPTTQWGLFWVQFDRFWILLICLFCFFSEFSLNALTKFYFNYLPILGPTFGTVPLGFLQVFISCSLLSHYLQGFPLVMPWFLFFIGILNILAGLAFGYRGKLRRSLKRSKRDLNEQKQQKDLEKAVPLSTAIRTLTKTRIDEINKLQNNTNDNKRVSISVYSKPSGRSDENISLLHRQPSNVRSVRSAMDAFQGGNSLDPMYGSANATALPQKNVLPMMSSVPLPSTNDEVLRWRARQENLRAEKAQEMMENKTPSNLSRHFQYDLQNDITIPRDTPPICDHDAISLRSQIQRAQQGMSRDLTSPCQSRSRANDDDRQFDSHYKRSSAVSARRPKFKRRTLVLSKVVQQVRRGSLAAIQATTRTSQLRMPGSYYRNQFKSKEKPSPWTEVNKKGEQNLDPPPRSYIPGRSRTTSIDLDNVTDHERMSYYQTPLADRFPNCR